MNGARAQAFHDLGYAAAELQDLGRPLTAEKLRKAATALSEMLPVAPRGEVVSTKETQAPEGVRGFDDAYFVNLAAHVIQGTIPRESVDCEGLADDLTRIASALRAQPAPASEREAPEKSTGVKAGSESPAPEVGAPTGAVEFCCPVCQDEALERVRQPAPASEPVGIPKALEDAERVLMRTIRKYGQSRNADQHDGAEIVDNTIGIGELTIGDLRRAAFAIEGARKLLAIRQPAPGETEPVGKWSDNVLVSRIGEACNRASKDAAGDSIDRGLALIRHLHDSGFSLYAGAPAPAMEPERDRWRQITRHLADAIAKARALLLDVEEPVARRIADILWNIPTATAEEVDGGEDADSETDALLANVADHIVLQVAMSEDLGDVACTASSLLVDQDEEYADLIVIKPADLTQWVWRLLREHHGLRAALSGASSHESESRGAPAPGGAESTRLLGARDAGCWFWCQDCKRFHAVPPTEESYRCPMCGSDKVAEGSGPDVVPWMLAAGDVGVWRRAALQARRDLQAIEDECARGVPPLGPGDRFASWTSPANTMRWIDRLSGEEGKP